MNIKNITLIITSTFFLAGCGATLQDFQKMTPTERASKTCSNDPVVRHHKNNERAYFTEVAGIETLLMNGYKTIQNCTTTIIDDRNVYRYGVVLEADREYTRTEPKKKIIQRCSNKIIPLTNYAVDKYEIRKNDLLPMLKDAKKRKQDAFDSCFNRVVDMSPEKAFGYYKN